MASTIKVDNVQNQPGTNIVSKCGTDVTLGASGDTVALACGASQTGFGRTGTVDWITTPKVTGDSPITGVTGKGYFLNTTAGEITINLPAGAAGSIISMADYAATWQTNKVTVSPNGSEKIGSLNENAVLSTEGQSVTFVYVDSTQGWVNTMDSTSNVRGTPPYIAATGGTPACGTTCGDYKVHKFTGPGTFCVSRIAACSADNAVAYIVVAGGGGGGGQYVGGGGGAGGFREGFTTSVTPYTASPLAAACSGITVTASPYAIVVGGGGAGGAGAAGTRGVDGSDSSGLGITSTGGGNGGQDLTGVSVGNPGGSGGGGSTYCSQKTGGSGDTPSTTPDQGFDGGDGVAPGAAGGGGGATAVGAIGVSPGPAPARVGGPGGAGATTSIDGTPTARAGGGGGSSDNAGTQGTGGAGGGGAAVYPGTGTAGGINTGGGGGGTTSRPGPCAGGLGGSGIVIIRYKFQ
jgi:hypothetical protein